MVATVAREQIPFTRAISVPEAGQQLVLWPAAPIAPDAETAMWFPGLWLRGDTWFSALQTYDTLRCLAAIPGTGVTMISVLVLVAEPFTIPDPLWRCGVLDYERLWPEDLPDNASDGFRFTTPLVELAVYRAYLKGGHDGATHRDQRRCS